MGNNISGREFIMGVKKSSTWHTAVECGAGDGVLVTGESLGDKAPAYLDDDSLGQDDVRYTDKVSEMVSGTIPAYLRYEGLDTLLALALGTSSNPTAVEGTAYSNVYSPAANIEDYFATLCMKKAGTTNGVWEIPSAKVHGFTLAAQVGQFANLTFNVMGNKFETDDNDAVNGQTTVGNITYPDRDNIAKMNANFKVRMNAQGGGALADSDKIYPFGFTLTYNRPMDANYESGNIAMAEPTQSGFAERSLVLNFDKYNADTFMDAVEAGTEYKLDITFQGAIISGTTNYLFRIDVPKIQWIIGSSPVGGPGKIPHVVTGRPMGVASTPTGMTVTDPISIYVINTRTTNPLA